MSTYRTPTGTNAFLPDWKATGQVIAFAKDPAKFKINQYVQLIPTKLPLAVYLYMDPDSPVRLYNRDAYKWPDSAERPLDNGNQQPFRFEDVRTERYNYGWILGDQTIDNADWQIRAQYSQNEMTRAMVSRTLECWQILETTASWGTHTDTANNLNGGAGFWDQASADENDPNYNAILKTLMAAVEVVFRDTNEMVLFEDLVLVLTPADARKMATSAEIREYRKNNVWAKAAQEGTDPNPNERFGLPSHLYGIKVIVETAVMVTTAPTAATSAGTRRFVKTDGYPTLLARPGELDGSYGTQNFSTVCNYYYTGKTGGLLRVESFKDAQNEREVGAVVEQYKHALVAPVSGYLIQGAFSA